MMRNPQQLPYEETLLAASELFNVEIQVYHYIRNPVIYNANTEKTLIEL